MTEKQPQSTGSPRVPGWYGMITIRKDGPLPPNRAASRLSAYVYGNILVLAAVAVATPQTVDSGRAAALVIGTGVTTYIAHVFADLVAHGTLFGGAEEDGAEEDGGDGRRARRRESALDELRDAVPIVTSAIWPTAFLALAWLGVLPEMAAQLIAAGTVIARIASVPIVAERVRGNPFSLRLLIAGVGLAVLAAIVVVIKTLIGH